MRLTYRFLLWLLALLRFLPNALTVARMITITPALGVLFLWAFVAYYEVVPSPEPYLPWNISVPLAGLILTAGGWASDGLDGWLAKTFGWESAWGAKYDPLADKWFTYTGFAIVPLHYGLGFYLIWLAGFGYLIHLYSRQTTAWRREGKILCANPWARRKSGVLFAVQLTFMAGIYLGGSWWMLSFPLAFVGSCVALVMCAHAYDDYQIAIREDERSRAAQLAQEERQSAPLNLPSADVIPFRSKVA